ncbi:MAG: ABC transporter permease [Pyrinomonadaceae bacterium]|nr:ABC transporter permease [Phycisphaerales bacterium]
MIRLGLTSLRLHILRSILTALGIIIGVAAVITMVSVGEGTMRQAISQLERLGAKNIIIRSHKPPETQQSQGGQRRSFVSKFGITREDMKLLEANFPGAEAIVPLKEVGGQVHRENRRKVSQAFGTTPALAKVANLLASRGRFLTNEDLSENAMVCVLGSQVAHDLYPFEEPLGQTLRIDEYVLRVVGVMAPVGLAGGAGAALVGRDLSLDVYIPITTATTVFGDTVFRRESGSFQASEVQISEIYVSAPSREVVLEYASLIERIMMAKHPDLKDIGLHVPYQLLQNARKSALTAKASLVSVAVISLIVGGIGIMNIMLASVTERTREIGIRRALGATRKHVVAQFLVETCVLGCIGGALGVLLGVGMSVFIEWFTPVLPTLPWIGTLVATDITQPTYITGWSIVVAFLVATLTGLVFGLYPAMRAAKQDPIVALRHD